MDCSKLLSQIQSIESSLPPLSSSSSSSSSHWGHNIISKPNVHILPFRKKNGMCIVMGYTKRVCGVQIVSSSSPEEEEEKEEGEKEEEEEKNVVIVWTAPLQEGEEEEVISCAALLPPPSSSFSSKEEEEEEEKEMVGAVVLGTNQSHLFSVQLELLQKSQQLSIVSISKEEEEEDGIYEVLPLDSASSSSASTKTPLKRDQKDIHPPPPTEEEEEEEEEVEDYLQTPKKRNTHHSTNTNKTPRAPPPTTTTTQRKNNNHRHRYKTPLSNYKYPFSPKGGIVSLTPYNNKKQQQQQLSSSSFSSEITIWIVYQDGTTVRTPLHSFFPSLSSFSSSSSVSTKATTTIQTKINPPPAPPLPRRSKKKKIAVEETKKKEEEWEHVNVVPLPKHHASLLSPLPPSAVMMKKKELIQQQPKKEDQTADEDEEEQEEEEEEEFYEAMSYTNINNPPKKPEHDSYPTLSFHTCENPLRYTTHTSSSHSTENMPLSPRLLQEEKHVLSPSFNKEGEREQEKKKEEEEEEEEFYDVIRGAVVGGTKALVRGVAGSVIGAVRWGFSGNEENGDGGDDDDDDGSKEMRDGEKEREATAKDNKKHHDEAKDASENKTEVEEDDNDDNDNDNGSTSSSKTEPPPPPAVSLALSQLHNTPTQDLPLGMSMLDPPRRFTSITVDPDGDLAAAADTLGRVLLIDLETKQVVRMWKGVREAVCFWIQLPRPSLRSSSSGGGGGSSSSMRTLTYLVVHARQRRVVEVWRMRHGPRVLSMQVGQDVQIVQCFAALEGGDGLPRCYIVQTNSTGGNTIEPLIINDPSAQIEDNLSQQQRAANRTTTTSNALKPSTSSTAAAALKLASLKQLLSSETNVPSTPGIIYEAFAQIHSLSDLIIALDLVAASTHIEDGMNIDGSAFHALAVAHCQEKLRLILNDDEESVSLDHPSVVRMKKKLAYYNQLIDAYDILHKFEATAFNKEDDEDEDEDESEQKTPRTSWAVEAVSWIETYESVTGRSIDDELLIKGNQTALKFSAFVKACSGCNDAAPSQTVGSNDDRDKKQTILLCDSTKDRTAVLTHIFRPLLKDIFVFKTVNSMLDALGIRGEYDSLQQYFGEWFMTVPGKDAANVSLFGLWSPTVRWLQEIVAGTFDPKNFVDTETGEQKLCLETLHTFCSKAADLPRAFLLAVVCREAISVATKQLEEKTYGQISCEDAVKPWDILLRKLRVCLLVTLRLDGAPFGPLAVTITNIEEENAFSIYEWIARDELFISHKQDEVVALEDACSSSRQNFCPSLPEGDSASRWKLLQNACKAKVGKGERASRFFMSGDADQPGPLLLYLQHFYHPVKLAAHRALLLGGKWGQEPQSLHLLEDCISALRSLEAEDGKNKSIAAAVRVEVWEIHIRPVYRALLFGFHDVPELSEDVMAPLCYDPDWLSGLAHLAQEILSLVARTPSSSSGDDKEKNNKDSSLAANSEDNSAENSVWPPVVEDMILQRLLFRPREATQSSLELHRAIISASQLTDDLSELAYCIPSFDDVFLQGTIYHEMPTPSLCSDDQVGFVNRALKRKAHLATGPVVDHFELYEIENLGRTWGIDRTQIRTNFLIAMYENGKDAMIDELMNSSTQYLDSSLFISSGLEIACMRLYSIIMYMRGSRQFRGIIGMLDADTCQWVKEQHDMASGGKPRSKKSSKNDEEQLLSLPSTHAFILRIMTMASGIKESGATEKAHTLSIMSGTLLKAVQDYEESGAEMS